jgi:hypothetical protein
MGPEMSKECMKLLDMRARRRLQCAFWHVIDYTAPGSIQPRILDVLSEPIMTKQRQSHSWHAQYLWPGTLSLPASLLHASQEPLRMKGVSCAATH